MSFFIEDNILWLSQLEAVLAGLDNLSYIRPDGVYHSCLGGHVRHILNFYENLLEGTGGVVRYDRRTRDTPVEKELEAGRSAVARMTTALRVYEERGWDPEGEVIVAFDESPRPDGAPVFSRSTLGREWQFVAFHALHHYAMIRFLLAGLGHPAPADFGVAVSTLEAR